MDIATRFELLMFSLVIIFFGFLGAYMSISGNNKVFEVLRTIITGFLGMCSLVVILIGLYTFFKVVIM